MGKYSKNFYINIFITNIWTIEVDRKFEYSDILVISGLEWIN